MEALSAGYDMSMGSLPPLHFTIKQGELRPTYAASARLGGGLVYDSPPMKRPSFKKQLSLDETHKKKYPNLSSPPMKRKVLPCSPSIAENEELVDDFERIDINDNEINTTDNNTNTEESNKRKRKVSFADMMGKELEHVKYFEVPKNEVPLKVKEPEPELEDLELSTPLSDIGSEIFQKRYQQNNIILEKINLGKVNFAGRIRIAHSKGKQRRVAIRYTKDGWMSFIKVPANYFQTVDGIKDNNNHKKDDKKTKANTKDPYDIYCFEIGVDRNVKALQLFVSSCDESGKGEYEDTNDGQNYTILNPNYKEPEDDDEESDSSEEELDSDEDSWA